LVESLTLFKLYVSHGSATKFVRGGEKCYVYFVNKFIVVSNSERIFKIG